MGRFRHRLALLTILLSAFIAVASAQNDPLPSWNDGDAKKALMNFVQATTNRSSKDFVPPEQRIATFDQDGTTWVEQPFYAQINFALDRVRALAPKHPEWKTKQPFQAVLSGDKAAMAKFTMKDLEAIVMATHTGMTVDEFRSVVKEWISTARNKKWDRPYTELVYQPMLEAMKYLRDNGYRVYIVTGGGQEFVRAYAQEVYGVEPEYVIGSALETEYGYNAKGEAVLMKAPKLLLNNDHAGKPEDIYLFTGRHPKAAFGNSAGDREMLEYAQASGGPFLCMLVLHDDPQREYAYGPAQGLPDSKIGTFPPALYQEAKSKGWTVISMKNDWKRIFSFEK
jgi:phosphoserine phosphatase